MIQTVVKIHWLNLKRDKVALVLTFILPLTFFSVFATIFGGMGGGGGGSAGMPTIDVVVVDQDGSDVSGKFLARLSVEPALDVATAPDSTAETPLPEAYSLEDAKRLVREGDFPVALVLPVGFGDAFGDFSGAGEPVELIYDAADPIARHSVNGLLQAAAMGTAPDLLMKRGLAMLEAEGGALTAEQRRAVNQASAFLQREDSADGGSGDSFSGGLVQVAARDVRSFDTLEPQEEKPQRSIVAYYAAGIGVMFLLFSMAGAGGALLEEEESGVLERLLVSNVPMSRLLLGKWLFFTAMGLTQVVVMFVWGAVAFGLDLWIPRRLFAFAAMALVTAGAAAAFGIVLATACRSRAQLSGTSTVVVLLMSAMGGSMVPRFLMPDFMDVTALFTLNGWALDGFLKVFWYDDPKATVAQSIFALAPQLAVLSGITVGFLALARVLARRWETV